MRRLCIVAAGFGGLLAESAGPLADGHQASTTAIELRRLHHDEAKSDQHRLAQLRGSVEHMTASDAPRLSTSYETDRELYKSEDRSVMLVESMSLSDSILKFETVVAKFIARKLPPITMFEGLSLHESVFDPYAVIMWLKYAQGHPNLNTEEALKMLKNKSGRDNQILVYDLLPHYKDEYVKPIIKEALKLAMIGMLPQHWIVLAKMLEKMGVSSRAAFDLLGLEAKDALVKTPEAAIFWLKYVVHAKWNKPDGPPVWDAKLNPDYLFPREAADLLVDGKRRKDLNSFVEMAKQFDDLKESSIVDWLNFHPPEASAVLQPAKFQNGRKKSQETWEKVIEFVTVAW